MKFSLITVTMALAGSSAQTAIPNNTVAAQELNQMIEDEQGLLQQEIELLTALTADEAPLLEGMTATRADITVDYNDVRDVRAVDATVDDEPSHASESTEEMMTMEHDDVSAHPHESNHQHKKSEKARAKAAKAAGHHRESKSSKEHHAAALSMMSVAAEEEGDHHSKKEHHHAKQTKSSKTHLAKEEHHSMVYEAKSSKSTDAHSMLPTDHVVYKAKSAKSKSSKAKSSKAHDNNMSVPRESLDHSMPTMAKSAKAHSEPSKAAKVAPPQLLLTKAHKSAKTGKKAKTHPHRGDDDDGGSLSMMTHSHGKSDKGHPAGGTATTTMEDATTDTHGGVGTNGDDGGGDTTSETADGTTASSITTPATGEVEGVVPDGSDTQPAVRAPDVKPRGAGGSELRNGEFQEEANGGALLHGEKNKAIGGHKKRQNVDALDMGDGREGVESSLVASASDVNSSTDVRGAIVGGLCMLVTSAYVVFA